MKLGPGMHIVMHLIFFGETGVTDRRFIRRYQVNSSRCVVYQVLRRYAPMVPSVHPTVSFSFLFFVSST
jgi:hypothetical protein